MMLALAWTRRINLQAYVRMYTTNTKNHKIPRLLNAFYRWICFLALQRHTHILLAATAANMMTITAVTTRTMRTTRRMVMTKTLVKMHQPLQATIMNQEKIAAAIAIAAITTRGLNNRDTLWMEKGFWRMKMLVIMTWDVVSTEATDELVRSLGI